MLKCKDTVWYVCMYVRMSCLSLSQNLKLSVRTDSSLNVKTFSYLVHITYLLAMCVLPYHLRWKGFVVLCEWIGNHETFPVK